MVETNHGRGHPRQPYLRVEGDRFYGNSCRDAGSDLFHLLGGRGGIGYSLLAYVMELFTTTPVRSAAAFGEGRMFSSFTGETAGALGSASYNPFAFLGRR